MGNPTHRNRPDDSPRHRYSCHKNANCDLLRQRCRISKALIAGFGGAITTCQPY